MEPVPSRLNGIGWPPGCTATNKRTTSRRCSRVSSDAKKRRRVIALGEVDKAPHALPDLGADLLQLVDIADGGIEAFERVEGFLPHGGGAVAGQLEHGIEQRSALQAECARTGSERAQEDEPAKPLVIAAERLASAAQELQWVGILRIHLADGMVKVRVADEVVVIAAVPAEENDR